MKYLLTFLFGISILMCSSILNAQTHFYHIPSWGYIHKNEIKEDIPAWDVKIPKRESISINELCISNLITLKEYKQFLQDVKPELNDSLYQKLLPAKKTFIGDKQKDYLSDQEYEDMPVVGISWHSAIEFCKWKTLKENKGDSIKFVYRLPTRYEWLGTRDYLSIYRISHDFSHYFSDWLMDSKYEDEHSIFYARKKIGNPDDEIKSKFSSQKKIIGKSYRHNFENLAGDEYWYAPNGSAPFLGFRIVKSFISISKKESFKISPSFFEFCLTSMEQPEINLLYHWNIIELDTVPKKKRLIANDYSNEPLPKGSDYFEVKYFSAKQQQEYALTGIPQYGPIRATGCYHNNKKSGDWQYFTRNGKLKKHLYYNEDGSVTKIEIKKYESHIPKDMELNGYAFAGSLKASHDIETEAFSSRQAFFETKNKRMNGLFLNSEDSFTVAGIYKDNLRTGKWCLFDKYGKIIYMINYKDGFSRDIIYPEKPSHKLFDILNTCQTNFTKKSEKYYEYNPLNNEHILYQKTVWTQLEPEDNPLLFKDNKLLELIFKHIKNGNIKAYKAKKYKDEVLTAEEAEKQLDPETEELINFRIEEVNYFDKNLLNLETNAVSISPFVRNKKTEKEKELFKIYINEMVNAFKDEMINDNDLPGYLKNYGNIFIFRYYGGQIIGASNPFNNRLFSQYVYSEEDFEKEAERELNIIFSVDLRYWQQYFQFKDHLNNR